MGKIFKAVLGTAAGVGGGWVPFAVFVGTIVAERVVHKLCDVILEG